MTARPPRPPLAFIDLAAQHARLRPALDAAVARVHAHGRYVMGPEVPALEAALAAAAGAADAVTCASGTDALRLPLMALGLGPGDAVVVPAFTFAATAEAVRLAGAVPVFADVDPDTFTLDPASLEQAIAAAGRAGLTPRAVIPVDLFGLPADYDALDPIAARADLAVIEDGAQGFGAAYRGRKVGALGRAGATSFYPTKPLGGWGDGGAVLTSDAALAARMRSLREHGRGSAPYDHVRVGLNSRLDTLQAAVLLQKLAVFDDELARRRRVAARYDAALGPALRTPRIPAGRTSVWAQYTLVLDDRDRVARDLQARGVPTAVHYPCPLHRQPAYRDCPRAEAALPAAEALAAGVLSLPIHPDLEPAAQDAVIRAVLDAAAPGRR